MPTPTDQRVEELKRLARDEFPDFDRYYAEGLLVHAVVAGENATPGASLEEEDENNSPEFSDRWGPEHEVRAGLIRWLCVNRRAKDLIDPLGIQLFNARITGDLMLDFVDVPFPIGLYNCRLTDLLSLVGVQIPVLTLSGSWAGNIYADSASVKASVFLNCGFRADGTVSLVEAQIGGALWCDEGTFIKKGGVAISADRINVGQGVFFRADKNFRESKVTPFRAEGAVRLHSARIGGDLDCTGGQFVNPDPKANRGRTIHLGPAIIQGTIFFRPGYGSQRDAQHEFKSDGIIDLRGASAGNLWDEPSGWPTKPGQLYLDDFVYRRFRTGDPPDPVLDACPADAKTRLKWLKLDNTPNVTQPYQQLAEALRTAGDSSGAKRVLEAMEEKLSSTNDLKPIYWLKRFIGFGISTRTRCVGSVVPVVGWLAGLLVRKQMGRDRAHRQRVGGDA